MSIQTDTTGSMSNTAFIGQLRRFCQLVPNYRNEPDRRATCRFQVTDDSIPVMIEGGITSTSGKLSNISSSGAQIVLDDLNASATAFVLRFVLGEVSYRHAAQMVRIQPHHGGFLLTACFDPGNFERVS